ncbi:hypothetical protein Tco_0438991, partial [Tanacetum coccineum]
KIRWPVLWIAILAAVVGDQAIVTGTLSSYDFSEITKLHAKRDLDLIHAALPIILGQNGLELRSVAYIADAKCYLSDSAISAFSFDKLGLHAVNNNRIVHDPGVLMRDQSTRFEGIKRVIIDEEGLDVLYWKNLDDGSSARGKSSGLIAHRTFDYRVLLKIVIEEHWDIDMLSSEIHQLHHEFF